MGSVKTEQYMDNVARETLVLPLVCQTIRLLSGKWKMQIVVFLLYRGKTRFKGLQRGICGISAKVLSKELQELEQEDMITRMVSDPKLTTVAYELTVHGKTLEGLIRSIADWGAAHLTHMSSTCPINEIRRP